MSYCPSHDWDRYINEQDEAAAAEVAFHKEHRALIVQVAAAIAPTYLKLGSGEPDAADIKQMVDLAANIVQAIVYRGEQE